MRVDKIFNCMSGNTGITEEFIYYSLGKEEPSDCLVLSSATTKEKMLGYIPKTIITENGFKYFFDKMGILVVRKGKAGKMYFLPKGSYTINDDAYILSLKDTFITKYALEKNEQQETFLKYFIYFHQYEVYEYATKGDNGTWSKTSFLKNCEINIESMQNMEELVRRYEKCKGVYESLQGLKDELKVLCNKTIALNIVGDNQVKLKDIFSYISRNDSLSQEGIYNFQPHGKEIITVLSGATENIYYGKIDKNTPKIHYLEGRQCLHVITRGNAGKITFIEKGTYATNTNAFLLYIDKDRWGKLNIHDESEEKVYLKFMLMYLQPLFLEECSNADVSVFPLTEVIKKLDVTEIMYDDNMQNAVKTYDKQLLLLQNLNDFLANIDGLMAKYILQ